MTAPTPEIELLRGGSTTFAAWHASLVSAETEVLFEMYWFASDETGKALAHALCDCADRGVDVRVLYDAVGSFDADSRMFAMMRASGVQVLEHNPISPWNDRFALARIGIRDHRKLLVVDGRIAYCGGINAAHVSAAVAQGGQAWRDDSVRVTGLAARQLRRLFIDAWKSFGGEPVRRPPPALVADDDGADSPGMVPHPSIETERTIHKAYLERIRGARRRVLIENAYFLPSPQIRRALRKAARRHVDVRILVPEKSDVRMVDFATSMLTGSLVRAGCDVRLYQKVILHAKSAVIDDWATVGSYNLDDRSRRYNLELNIASRDPTFVQSLVDSFTEDFADARRVNASDALDRAPHERALGWLFWRLRRYL